LPKLPALPTHPIILGALLILLGEALLAIMGGVIKHLSADLSTQQIVFFRNLAGLAMLLPILMRTGFSELKTQRLHWHIMRALVGLSAMYCYFFVLARMPLAEAFLVKLTNPFFMPLIAYLWLKESIGPNTRWAIIIGFIGVAFILRPGTDSVSYFALIGLMGAALAALAKVTIRKMGDTESSVAIVFYFGLISTLVSALPAFHAWQPVPETAWGWILFMGAVATLGQLALTRAYRTAPTGRIGIYVYSSVIYGALMGWIFWDEIPLWTTWLGSALIIAAGLINIKKTTKNKNKK
jgi:drug/metabolite transporter (DMT)-like permease